MIKELNKIGFVSEIDSIIHLNIYKKLLLSEVQMWLREKHQIHVSIIIRTGTGMHRSRIDYKIKDQWKNDIAGIFNSYEQALEAGILKTIKLIKGK